MNKKILSFGSLNIDYVYAVPHFVRPGETIASTSLEIFAGGKGGNQTVALARAGAHVFHAGKIGSDGDWLKESLEKDGVNTSFIRKSKTKNGHALIQVSTSGQNAIVLYAGANKEIEEKEIDQTLSHFSSGDYLLIQNEINNIEYLIRKGHAMGMKVIFNPAPMEKSVFKYPLELVDTLIVNETEAEALVHKKYLEEMLVILTHRYPKTKIILTLGKEGVFYRFENTKVHVPAREVKVVDTTGAGDTFIGYYLASHVENESVEQCLRFASDAAALSVTKKGAQVSIPWKKDVIKAFNH